MDKDTQIYFEWDTSTWSQVLKAWDTQLSDKKQKLALELGSRRGGLSLLLSKNYNMNIVCSDLNDSLEEAKKLHQIFDVQTNIRYENIDCLKIPYNENTFDVVVFKSVIGALSTFENQKQAFSEIHRVLKPNGVLLFAENARASAIHMILRKIKNPWSTYWRYLPDNDMNIFLENFSKKEVQKVGFFTAFSFHKILYKTLFFIDELFKRIIPNKSKYVIFGYAIK